MTTPLAAKIAREYGTPVAVIDMDRVERNIARVQKTRGGRGDGGRRHRRHPDQL
jgi:D-serine deaminase-like pyridoxal phosphate-dependent protein